MTFERSRANPTVLLVDDDPESLRGTELLLDGMARTILLHPGDVDEQDLRSADLLTAA
jgi:hypothetical protein